MAELRVLNAGVQPLHQSWQMVVSVTDALGALLGGVAVTAAIWNPASNLWWSALGTVWGVAREDIPMTASTNDGLHTLDLDPAMMVGGEADLVLVVASDIPLSTTAILQWRHDQLHAPITLTAAPVTVATFGQLMSVLALWHTSHVRVNDDTKQLVVYLPDGVTPALSFNLKDAQGLASAMEPFQRLRV